MGLEVEPPTLQRPRSPRSAVNAAEEIPEAPGRGRPRRGRDCGDTERSGRSAVTSARPCPPWDRQPRGRGSLGLCPTKMKRRGSFSATLLRRKIGPGRSAGCSPPTAGWVVWRLGASFSRPAVREAR